MNPATNLNEMSESTNIRFGKTFLALFGLGLLGVLSLIPTLLGQLETLPPALADLSLPVALAVSLINSVLLLAVAVAIGTLLAHRVGLRSVVAEKVRQGAAIWPQLRPNIAMSFLSGLIFAVITIAADALINPFGDTELLSEAFTETNPFSQLVLGLLYGGIVEELLLRWGFMTLLVWLGWLLFQRGQGLPRPALVWTAIILAALLFGIGHLPALAALVALTPLLVARTILLNALGGVLFGWLFWRRSLEVAMLAHASAHIGFFLIRVIAAAFA
jgi:membrane protease YdiL (CAAX protease family)